MRKEGYDVDETGSTTEAILMVAQLQPDLVLLELDAIGTAGLELCGELRMLEVSRDVPIVLVSRNRPPKTRWRAVFWREPTTT
jgi:two-component system phosphate regulon response regulator PhoB